MLFDQIMPKRSRVLINICSNAGEYLKLKKLKSHCLKGRFSGSISWRDPHGGVDFMTVF